MNDLLESDSYVREDIYDRGAYIPIFIFFTVYDIFDSNISVNRPFD